MTASQIALVFGAPASRDEFAALATGAVFWDYGTLLGASPAHWEAVYEAHYAQVVEVMAALCALARQRGFSTYRRATLAHLRHACAHHKVVIVFGHWKSSHVLEHDFLPGWETAVRALADHGGTPLATLLAEHLDASAPLAAVQCRDLLNNIIVRRKLQPYMPAGLDGPVQTSKLILEAISREMIDRDFAGSLRPGNCLELGDGLYNAAEVTEAIGVLFQGVLDLSCCTSSILATYMGNSDGRVIIGGDELVIPAPHMRMVHWVLSNVSADGSDYDELRLACARALHDRHVKASTGIDPNHPASEDPP